MANPTLKVKTPLTNIILQLRGDVNTATKEPLVCASLGRQKGLYFESVVFTFAGTARCRLEIDNNECSLWIGGTAFDVRAADTDLISTTFGIRVVKHGEGQQK